jgi:site-specific DNA-methyltransferase (adenine-specific)
MYKNEEIEIHFKSSEKMSELKNNTVALVVTSPPYFNYIEYGGTGIGIEKVYKEYLKNIKKVFKESKRVLIDGGTCVINITNMKSRLKVEKKSFLYPIVPDIVKIMNDLGYIFFDEIVWVKGNANNGALKGKPLFGSYPYPPTPKILDSIFENILIFRTEGKQKDRYNKELKETSRLTKEEWRDYTKGIWFIEPDRKAKHPATFPIEIPKRLIKLYSFKNELILDPFAGTGTTLLAAKLLGRKGIGYEISNTYLPEIEEKFENIKKL